MLLPIPNKHFHIMTENKQPGENEGNDSKKSCR